MALIVLFSLNDPFIPCKDGNVVQDILSDRTEELIQILILKILQSYICLPFYFLHPSESVCV
jgi:hypothetical protein